MKNNNKYVKIILVILPLVVILSVIAVFVYRYQQNHPPYPFRSLTVDQIASVEAHYGAPEYFQPYELSPKEISELVDALHQVVLYEKTDYTKYTGYQRLMFIIYIYEREEPVAISACGSLFFIDYDTAYLSEPVASNHVGDIYWRCVEKITGEKVFPQQTEQ